MGYSTFSKTFKERDRCKAAIKLSYECKATKELGIAPKSTEASGVERLID